MNGNQESIPNDVSIGPTTTHPSKDHFLTPKGFVPIIVLVLVVLTIALGGFYLARSQKPTLKPQNTKTVQQPPQSPSPTPLPSGETANWKTFTNTKVGFQIRYPPRYTMVGLPIAQMSQNDSEMVDATQEDDHNIHFEGNENDSFTVYPLHFKGTIDALLTSAEAETFLPGWVNSQNVTIKQSKQITIDGVNALWETAAYKTGRFAQNDYVGVFFVKKDHGFMIHFSPNYNEAEINQILSTFKFTDRSQAAFEAPPLYPKFSWGKPRAAEFAPNDHDTNVTTVTGEEITSTGPSQKLSPNNDIFVYYQDYFAKYPEWKPYLSANMASIDGLYASEAGWKQGNHYFIVRVGNLQRPTKTTIWRN